MSRPRKSFPDMREHKGAAVIDLRRNGRRRTITLGIIIHGGLSNPFYAEIAMGAEEAAAEQGFDVLLSNAHGDPQRERESVERLLTRRVDGIVFSTALRSNNVQLALDVGVSAVTGVRPSSSK